MALERVPADIRRDGGVARMSDPTMIRGIQEAVTIPVMAKARIGHFAEAQVLEALEVDYVDESEVLTPADEANHIDKWGFKVPFVCGATNLGEALRRIGEGAAMIRSKGEAGTGDIVEAVRHLREITADLRRLRNLDEAELPSAARDLRAPLELVRGVAEGGRLPVVLFCAGGIATPADASLVMQLGAEGVVRGLGDLQVLGPAATRPRHRRGHDALRRPRARRPRLRGAGRGDDLARGAQAGRRAAPQPTRLVAGTVPPVVGVLALQGDFEAHARLLRACGAEPREVRVPAELEGLDGLVLPGGESTVMTLGIEREGLAAPLRALHEAGTPILGTCAGLIMADRDHLGLIDVRARRNAFGRQIRSFEADLDVAGLDGAPMRAVFIRAPWIDEAGPEVEVLASVDGHGVVARQDGVLVAAFHPELADDPRLHRLFLERIAKG